jgi:hypothetical protein
MRWDALFEDMEAQLAAEARLQLDSEITERSRVDVAGLELAGRLRASLGHVVTVHLLSGSAVSGRLNHVGSEWLVVNEEQRQVLVPHAAIGWCAGLGRQAVTELSGVRTRLGLASALRALSRDRSDLALTLANGAVGELTVHGVIDRVGRDHVDLAVTRPGEPRRAGNVLEVATVPFAALRAIRSPRSADF